MSNVIKHNIIHIFLETSCDTRKHVMSPNTEKEQPRHPCQAVFEDKAYDLT